MARWYTTGRETIIAVGFGRSPRDQSFRPEQDDEDDNGTIKDEAVFGSKSGYFGQYGQDNGSGHRSPERLYAANQEENDEGKRDEKAEFLWIEDQYVMGLDGTTAANDRATESESHDPHPKHGDAGSGGSQGVVPNRSRGEAQS